MAERMLKGARVHDKGGRTGTVTSLYRIQLKRRVQWDDGGDPSTHHVADLEEI